MRASCIWLRPECSSNDDECRYTDLFLNKHDDLRRSRTQNYRPDLVYVAWRSASPHVCEVSEDDINVAWVPAVRSWKILPAETLQVSALHFELFVHLDPHSAREKDV